MELIEGTKIKNLKNMKFGELTVVEFKGVVKNVAIWECKCSCGKIKSVRSSCLINGSTKTCGMCNTVEDYLIEKYGEKEAHKYWSDKNKAKPSMIAKGSTKKIWIKCENNEHPDYEIDCHNFSRGTSCPICSNKKVIKGINDISTTRPNLVRYFENIEDTFKYSFGSEKKVWMVCPDCGKRKSSSIKLLNRDGFFCDRCSDGISYPNKLMGNILEKSKIEFISEYSPDWVKPKRYDFYIPSMNLIIEMDGGFHFKEIKITKKTIEEIKKIDILKEEKAVKRGIKVIRVNCKYDNNPRFEYIKNNIEKELSNIININQECWNECDILSNKSLVYDICTRWKSGKYYVPSEIARECGLCSQTVIKYLKIGNKHGWCNYLPEITKKRTGKRKKVEMFKDGKSIGVFDCANKIVEQSRVFGVDFKEEGIMDVCRKQTQIYKGYYFEYIKEENI